jgi:hypothetical protein
LHRQFPLESLTKYDSLVECGGRKFQRASWNGKSSFFKFIYIFLLFQDSDKASKVPVLKDYPKYWEPKKLEHGEYWWFTEVGEEAVEQPGEPVIELGLEAVKNERLEFRIDR